ncbi:MAG: hypothetical protein COS40_14555, partial [Deltaproteobacteria bacterium CG03_land_8_20_14_0_80_45_14]
TVGIGVPIPILNEEILRYTAVRDEEILAQVVDYSDSYPQCIPGNIGEVNYKQLKSGRITVQGKEIPTSGLSSYLKAREIAKTLKEWIEAGKFFLTQPVELLPSADSGIVFKALKERPIKKTA